MQFTNLTYSDKDLHYISLNVYTKILQTASGYTKTFIVNISSMVVHLSFVPSSMTVHGGRRCRVSTHSYTASESCLGAKNN